VTRARLGALVALLVTGLPLLIGSGLTQTSATVTPAYVFVIHGASLEELLAVDEFQTLASLGGAALLAHGDRLSSALASIEDRTDLHVIDLGAPPEVPADARKVFLSSAGDEVRAAVFPPNYLGRAAQVFVVSPEPSSSDLRERDTLGAVVSALLPPAFEGSPMSSITSDSTRRDGVIIAEDIAATIAIARGLVPERGSLFEDTLSPPPIELHERYLAHRRMYVPIGVAAVLYFTGAGLAAIAFLIRRRSVPDQWQRVAGWMGLSVPMLAVGLLAAGHLPELTYASAVPMIAIVAVFGTMAFSPLERREPTAVPAGIGAAVIGFFVVEALLGWSGMLTPLVGGSQLDGGRFFGLPNVAIGLLVGATMWVAQRVSTAAGFALTCAVALFAGLPVVGANLGAAVTLFAAAGLWLAVREKERLGVWMRLAAFVAVTVVGTGVLIVSHAISPFPTHVSQFEQDVEGVGGIWGKFLDRLQVGFDLIAGNPLALIPVVGIVVVLFLVLRPPPAIRETFVRWPAWRDANLVTVLAGVIAYLANDSGPAAVGFAFGLALGGMLGMPLLVGSSKMGAE
jgi:hypothetical protein